MVKSQDKKRPEDPLNWVYLSGLGDKELEKVTDSDVLTAIQFDQSGEFLAVGDKGGRVIIFQ